MQIPSRHDAARTALLAYAAQPARLSSQERAQVYACVIGVPGGTSGELQPNREFNDLWLRFVSSVAQFGRQAGSRALNTPALLSGEPLRSAAHDLAAQVAPLVSAACARDMWQVIDQVSEFELGGAVNSTRYRSLADSGGTILEWLTVHGSVADAARIAADDDLVNATEQWLAASGASDQQVEALSQPDSDAHRIDLSRLVSKTIGETEKNIGVVFSDAPRSGAVLQYDESASLFGKRP